MACEFCGQPARFRELRPDDARALGRARAWLCDFHYEHGSQRHFLDLPAVMADHDAGDGSGTLPDGT